MTVFRGRKRIFWALLVVAAVVGPSVSSKGASPAERGARSVLAQAVLSIGTAEGKAGESVCIGLSLSPSDGTGISALTTDVTYDPSVLTPAGISTALPGKRAEGNKISEGVYRVTVFGGGHALPDGTIASVCFATSTGQCGSFALGHAQGAPTASDPIANFVPISGAGGGIKVGGCSSGVPGDCDNGGSVSIAEVQQVVNMFLGSAQAGCGADCDSDGSVSIGELQKVLNAYLGLASSCSAGVQQPAQVRRAPPLPRSGAKAGEVSP